MLKGFWNMRMFAYLIIIICKYFILRKWNKQWENTGW